MTAPSADSDAFAGLACPCCGSLDLAREPDRCRCVDPGCNQVFPIVDDVPILINEARSLFRHASFLRGEDTTMSGMATGPRRESLVKSTLRRLFNSAPSLASVNPNAFTPVRAVEAALDETILPRILVLGCGDVRFAPTRPARITYTDVTLGPVVMLIADAHDIPFGDGTFDLVIAAAVLQHVAYPERVVAEIHRVLKPGGLVYAESPFMQQVHLGRYDFTRYTFLGYRRLFRMFDDIEMGIAGGPGMALAWSLKYYVLSFAEGPTLRTMLEFVTRFLVVPVKWADRYLVKKKGAYDAASAFYFFGKRRSTATPEDEIMNSHRGLNSV